MFQKKHSIRIPDEAKSVLQKMAIMSSHKSQIYIAGGAVRDLLLNRPMYDLDLITRDEEKLSSLINADIPGTLVNMGEKAGHNCYRFVFSRDIITDSYMDSFAQLIQENIYMSHQLEQHFWIDIAQMHGRDIQQDLAVRDFTVNAMALPLESFNKAIEDENGSLATNHLIDPFSGLKDLQDKTIKAVSPSIFYDDPLRLWRMWRLAAALDFSPDADLLKFAEQNNHLCCSVPGERVRSEILMLLSYPNGAVWMVEAAKNGLVENQFPNMLPLKRCEQGDYHHQDAWEHSLQVLKEIENIINNLSVLFKDKKIRDSFYNWLYKGVNLSVLKLSGLLHDIGKPEVREVAEDGRIRFFNHEKAGLSAVKKIAGELCLSRKETEYLLFLVSGHLQILNIIAKANKKTQVKFWRNNKENTHALILLGCADMITKKGPRINRVDVENFVYNQVPSFVDLWLSEVKPALEKEELLTGKELMDYFHLKPGRHIGILKDAIREAQLDGLIKTREEAFALAGKIIKEKHKIKNWTKYFRH